MSYTRINWQNAPSEATALNDVNLNKMDSAIYDHDTRLDTDETAIANKVDKVTNYGLCFLKNIVPTPLPSGQAHGTKILTLTATNQSDQQATVDVYNQVVVDSALSDSSENPVQNKVVKGALDDKVDKEAGKGLSTISAIGVTASANTGETIADIVAIDQSGNTYHNYIKNGVVVDSTLDSSSENPIQNKVVKGAIDDVVGDVEEIIEDKADKIGESPELVSGGSMALVTPEFEENEPYVYRQSCGGKSNLAPIMKEQLIGGSVVWNQLVDKADFPASSGIFTNNGDGSITVNGTPSETVNYDFSTISKNSLISGHKYLILFNSSLIGSSSIFEVGLYHFSGTGTDHIYQETVVEKNDYKVFDFVFRIIIRNGYTANNLKFTPQFIDLTAMFGSTIANYIYTLESGNAGAGVAWFRKYFPEVYYAYSAPTIQSTKVSGKKVVGFNKWDEQWEQGYLIIENGNEIESTSRIRSKNYIPVIPNTTYWFQSSDSGTDDVIFYDKNKNYIGYRNPRATGHFTITPPNNCYYIRFCMWSSYGGTYKNDICLNLHWDGERDGEYEPYKSTTYDLSGSHLVKRNYEYRAYASGDESLPDTITDGTNTVTKRTTPITETVTNPTLYGIWKLDANNNLYFDGDTCDDIPNPQIVENGGTEEFIDAEVESGNRDVSMPCGGNRKYRQAVEVPALPTDGNKVQLTFNPANGQFTWE